MAYWNFSGYLDSQFYNWPDNIFNFKIIKYTYFKPKKNMKQELILQAFITISRSVFKKHTFITFIK